MKIFSVLVMTVMATMAWGQAGPVSSPPASSQPEAPAIDLTLIPSPTMVSLKLEKAAPEAAIKDLAKASGFDIQPYYGGAFRGQRTKPATINVSQRPFWEVFRDVCVAGDISVAYNYQYDRVLKVMAASNMGRNYMKAPSSMQGAAIVLLNQLTRTNTVDLLEPAKINRVLQVQFAVLLEPKNRILQYQRAAKVTEARDENGNSLVVMDGSRQFTSHDSGNGIGFDAQAPLDYPKVNPGKKIVTLKGYVECTLQQASEKFEIASPLTTSRTEKQFGTKTAVFESLKKLGEDQYELQLTLVGDAVMAPSPGGGDSIKLLDGQGGQFGITEASVTHGNPMKRRLVFQGSQRGTKTGEPTKVIWEVPTGSGEVKIPFEFSDVQMP